MEALVAIGLAGNVVQFASSAGTLIKEANTIRKSGSPSSLPKLKDLSASLTSQANVLQTRLKASSATLAEEDQNLLDLAFDCERAGKEFIAYLDGFMSSSSSTILRTTKTAIKFHWASHKINDFVSTLDRLRNSLNLATMLALRKNNDASNTEVLKHLNEILQGHQSQSSHTTTTQNAIELISHELRDQTSQTLKIFQERSSDCLDEIKALHRDMAQTENAIGREEKILRWLDFRQISWRYHTVDQAYNTTYEWIYQSPPEQDKWDDFAAFLGNDNVDPYFINGKAGSGKSTLMKFVQNHQTTRTLLQQWAGSEKLIISHFYSWNLGTPLQKTYIGLLRALLYEVLEQHPELIPAVFPKLYRERSKLGEDRTPEYPEIGQAFDIMINKSQFLKIVIFIDGIDEFEGDHRDMALLLRSLASSNVKMVLSSRPLNACMSALEGCPSLRLQDLTRSDIDHYVDKELSSHSLMVMAIQKSRAEASQLIGELTNKADGVFLWVILSVRILIEGLENGDNLNELKMLLNSLPADLKDLYRRMFAKIDSRYRGQRSELFQIVRQHGNTTLDRFLPTHVLHYALQPPVRALETQILTSKLSSLENDTQDIERRVRSRSCGLLEIRNLDDVNQYSSDVHGTSFVTYLHRTVGEFIELEEIWTDVCSATEGTDFDPAINLASAWLAVMKTVSLCDYNVRKSLKSVALCCRRSTKLTPEMAHRYVVDFDKIMCSWNIDSLATYNLRPILTLPWSQIHTHLIAAEHGIVKYFQSMPFLEYLAQLHGDQSKLYYLLLHVLDLWRSKQHSIFDMTQEERLNILTHLLTNVLGPDNRVFGPRLWFRALQVCRSYPNHRSNSYEALRVARLLLVFLRISINPEALWQRACEDMDSTQFDPTLFIESWESGWERRVEQHLIGCGTIDELNRTLDEIKTLITPKDDPSSSRNATGNSKERKKSRKRKNKDHGPQKKRRR